MSRLRACVPWLAALAVAIGLIAARAAADPATSGVAQAGEPGMPPGRVAEVIDGIRFEFAPAQASVVRELAPGLAALNREAAGSAPAAGPSPPPLSVADLDAHRAEYLRRIAAAIGLPQATPSQAECYDAFLANFQQSEFLWDALRAYWRQMSEVRSVVVWTKGDLMTRLRAGEKIAGFALDPDGQRVNFNWNVNFDLPQELAVRLKALRQERERFGRDYSYRFSSRGGEATISGGVRPHHPVPSAAAPVAAPAVAAGPPPPIPVVISPDQAALAPADLAAVLLQTIRGYRNAFGSTMTVEDPHPLAYLIFHETTETGIMDRYLASADRRWLCEGVANYTAWQVARDVAGEAEARKVYDLPDQLRRYAALRTRVNLTQWPAVEHQPPADADAPLNKAAYAFATRAVSLMVARHGPDVLPKLFQAVGATPRRKANMRTVAKAYRKLTGEELSAILRAAVAPL